MTLAHLSMCLKRAVDDHKLRVNPCAGTELPPEDMEEAVPLTPDEDVELMALLTASVRLNAQGTVDKNDLATQTIRDALIFVRKTGVRRGEACRVQWDDIRGNEVHIQGTKNEASDRWIPIPPDVRVMLDRRKFTKSSGWIFGTRLGTPIPGLNLYRWMSNHTNHTVHELRHTYITRAAQAGINPEVLQKLTGHARVETLLRVYTHVTEQDKIDAVAKIEVYCTATAQIAQKDASP